MNFTEMPAALLERGWHVIVTPEMRSKHRRPGNEASVERTVMEVHRTFFGKDVIIKFWDGYEARVHGDLMIKVVGTQ